MTRTMQFQHCGGIDWRTHLLQAGAIDLFKGTAYDGAAGSCRKPQCSYYSKSKSCDVRFSLRVNAVSRWSVAMTL